MIFPIPVTVPSLDAEELNNALTVLLALWAVCMACAGLTLLLLFPEDGAE